MRRARRLRNTSKRFARKSLASTGRIKEIVFKFNSVSNIVLFRISRVVQTRQIRPWLQPEFLFKLSPMARTQADCLRILHGFTDMVGRRLAPTFKSMLADRTAPMSEMTGVSFPSFDRSSRRGRSSTRCARKRRRATTTTIPKTTSVSAVSHRRHPLLVTKKTKRMP